MVEVGIDWFSFSFNPDFDFYQVCNLLNVNVDSLVLLKGSDNEPVRMNGYKFCYMVDATSFYIMDHNVKPGVHISVSGKALTSFYRHFGSQFTEKDILHYFSLLLPYGHVTRLDIAIDDVGEKFFSVHKVYKLLNGRFYVSSIRFWDRIQEFHNDDSSTLNGYTLYIGKRSSDRFLRVYDKKLEHDSKLPDDLPLSEHVTRWELELKNDVANTVLSSMVNVQSVNNIAFGVLTDYIRFIVLDDSRRSRCSSRDDWIRFTDGIKGAHFVKSKKITSIDLKMDWLKNQVSRSLAICDLVSSEDFSTGLSLLGQSKLSSSDFALIRSYLDNLCGDDY